MKECREKKRLQVYLDGWLTGAEAARFEDHLKSCEDCQCALMELEEISAAALEMVDHAPEREYWDGFFNRVQNRIFSRDVSPYSPKEKSSIRIKIASYSIGIMSIAAAFVLTFGYLSRTNLEQGPALDPGVVERNIAEDDPVKPAAGEAVQSAELILEGAASQSEKAVADETIIESIAVSVEPVRNRSIVEEAYFDGEPSSSGLADFKSAFRNPARISPAALSLSDDENFVTRLLIEYGGLSMEDFSVSPNVVAEGILSGYRHETGRGSGGSSLAARLPSVSDGAYPRWGYLGVPPDSFNSDGFNRYTIELELMRAK